jgi:gluconokinase
MHAAPPLVVVMGVSGCGKSTVGALIAAGLGLEFLEGDLLHPPANVERMAAGVALTDADRAGWLQAIAERIATAAAQGLGLVVSCSALKRAYRDTLRAGAPALAFVHVHGTQELISQRLASRTGHYMPPSLLASQFAALEVPTADEAVLALDAALPCDTLAARALAWLRHPDVAAP